MAIATRSKTPSGGGCCWGAWEPTPFIRRSSRCCTLHPLVISAAAVRSQELATAQYADALWDLAAKSESPAYRSQALRAYIRGDPPQRLAGKPRPSMLKNAMKLADSSDNKRLALSRLRFGVTLVTSIDWIAAYLDDRDLAETYLPQSSNCRTTVSCASRTARISSRFYVEGRSDILSEVCTAI